MRRNPRRGGSGRSKPTTEDKVRSVRDQALGDPYHIESPACTAAGTIAPLHTQRWSDGRTPLRKTLAHRHLLELTDHSTSRKRNCADNPNCLRRLGENGGIWAKSPEFLDCGPDPADDVRDVSKV